MKKTFIIYGIYGVFAVMLLLMGSVMGLNHKGYALYILPIILFLAILPLILDEAGSVGLILAWLPFSKGVAQFELGVITINPYIAGMIALTLLAFFKMIFTGVRYQFNRLDFIIILLATIYFLSTIMADDVISSGYLAFHAIFVPVISYFVCKYYLKTEDDVKKAVIFLVMGIIVFSILAVIQFITTGERVAMLGMPFIGVATLTTTGLVFIFGTQNWKKPFWLVSSLIIFLGVVVSFSRVYLAIIIIAPFMYKMIRKGRGSYLINTVLAVTLIGTLIIAVNPEPFKPAHFDRSLERSFERITSLDFWKGSIYGRAYTYHYGLLNFLDAPVIGHGLQKGEVNITIHNFHVEWLVYSGFIGYMLWSYLFYFHYKRLKKFAVDDKYVATGLLMISLILTNSVTNGFLHGVMPTVAFILIGINEAKFLCSRKVEKSTNVVIGRNVNKRILREARGDV
ncbi:MAG: hypothetical protein QM504_08850 [Pseudomonadota bacterium]